MRWFVPVALAMVTAVVGCQEKLQPPEEVDELRVLGIRLDPPDARPGDDVTATALIADVAGDGWTATWYACETPISAQAYLGSTFDPNDGFCDTEGKPYGEELGTGTSATFTVPDGFLDEAKELLLAEGFTEDAESVDQLLAIIGWHQRVNLVVERHDGSDDVEATKRLVVSYIGGLNTNPEVPSLQMWEDGPDVVAPEAPDEVAGPGACLVPSTPEDTWTKGHAYVLAPVNVPESFEEYLAVDFTGEPTTVEEEYWYSWFSTHRGFNAAITKGGNPDVRFEVSPPVGQDAIDAFDGKQYFPMWVVVRDGRGGTSWCEQLVELVDAD